MESKLRMSIILKILLIILCITIVSNTVVGFNGINKSTPAVKTLADKYFLQVTDDVANSIVGINDREFALIHGLANMEMMRSDKYTLHQKQAQLNSILKELGGKYQNLAFYDKNGNAIRDTGELINLADRDYFKKGISGKDVLTDPTFSPVINAILTYYGTTVYGFDNKPIGVIILLIKGNSVQELVEQVDLGNGKHPSVINRTTGNVIARSEQEKEEDDDNAASLDSIMGELMSGNTGTGFFFDSKSNTKMICSYQPVPGTDWSVFAAGPYKNYLGAVDSIKTSVIICILLTIIVSVVASVWLVRLIIKPLIAVKDSITEIASGNADLSKRMPMSSNDEIGDVVKGFNQFIEKLQHIVENLKSSKEKLNVIDSDLQAGTQDTFASITQIIANIESVNNQIQHQSNSVSETATSVNEISSNIESLEKMIDNQARDVSQASAAVEEMIGNINSVTNAVTKMVGSFEMLEKNTNSGIGSLTVTNEKIKQINEESKMLQDANAAIANIAEQTNLLAMNAAIEAAHAGEAGKGFAVVADEIRKLSETSAVQSKTVSSELNKIQDTISQVVQSTSVTNEAFSFVSTNIEETSQIIHQIKGAMEEQQIGSKQIVDTLQSMNNSTVEVRSASSEMTVGNQQVIELIKELQDVTDNISQSMKEMKTGAIKINETGEALTDVSGKVEDSVIEIGKEVDLFKV